MDHQRQDLERELDELDEPDGIDVEELAEDIAMVEAARAGDRTAFAGLYRRFGPMIHGILLARVPRDEVGDLVQDVFVLALRKLDALRDPSAFGGWVARIARNRAADHFRRTPELDELPSELVSTSAPDTEAIAIVKIIRTLPEAYREPLILRLVEGMTGPEIARRTGMTPGSVRVNLHRGMTKLRSRLAGGHHD